MYTAEEILDMQKQCYAIIKEQNEKLKLAESEYAIMERELGDGNVYAEIDGKVVSVLTEEEARSQQQPLLKAILCGHCHHFYEERFSPTAIQYVVGAGYNGDAYEIEFR